MDELEIVQFFGSPSEEKQNPNPKNPILFIQGEITCIQPFFLCI